MNQNNKKNLKKKQNENYRMETKASKKESTMAVVVVWQYNSLIKEIWLNFYLFPAFETRESQFVY